MTVSHAHGRSDELTGWNADRCPGILALHRAEDGWLARIRLPGGRISPDQLEAVARLAGDGNGLVDLTARANLQVRGLSAGSGVRAAELLGAVGLLPSAIHERVRNVLASPVAGRHKDSLTAIDDLITQLDDTLCLDTNLAQLPGRFLFGIDDGSGLLRNEDLDVALFAEPTGSEEGSPPLFRLALGGVWMTARVTRESAVSIALDAARAFVGHSASERERIWRVRDLPGGGASLAGELGLEVDADQAPTDRISRALPVGLLEQNDGRVAVTALPPLGRLDGDLLTALAAAARRSESDVRLSPWRTLTIVDVATGQANVVMSELRRIGLQIEPNGWQALSACAGLGACEKARVNVRDAAARRAGDRSSFSAIEHWSACERRCGTPRAATVSIYALEDCLVLEDGSSRRAAKSTDEVLSMLAAEVTGE